MTAFVRLSDFVCSFVRFCSILFDFVQFCSFDFVRSILFVRFCSFDFVRYARAAMCYCRIFRDISSIDGCIVYGNR